MVELFTDKQEIEKMTYYTPYENKTYTSAKLNAQLNLVGRTHYVDEGTLKFHHSRVMKTVITHSGMILGIVTSDAANMDDTKRGFRAVIFDITGAVIYREELEGMHNSSAMAEKALWAQINKLDIKKVAKQAIERVQKESEYNIETIYKTLDKEQAQTA